MSIIATDGGIMARVGKFLMLAQAMLDRHYAEQFPNLPKPELIIAGGKRYLKIVEESIGGSFNRPEKRQRVFCFIDMNNGDLLKPESFKKPAKYARGNIYEPDFAMRNVGPYGIATLDSHGTLTPPAYAGVYNVQAEVESG